MYIESTVIDGRLGGISLAMDTRSRRPVWLYICKCMMKPTQEEREQLTYRFLQFPLARVLVSTIFPNNNCQRPLNECQGLLIINGKLLLILVRLDLPFPPDSK